MKLSGDRLIGASLLLFIAFIGTAFLMVVLRERRGSEPAKSVPAKSVGEAYAKALQTRQELIAQLIAALELAVEQNDRMKVAELSESLAKQGDDAAPAVLATLKEHRAWNLKIALLGLLGQIQSAGAIDALAAYYDTLKAEHLPYKLEVVRILSCIGGGMAQETLRKILSKESDAEAREAVAKALVTMGMSPEELASLEKRDRETLESKVLERKALKLRIEAIEKLDAKADEGLVELRKATLEESTVAVALAAMRKLEERGDGKGALILAERARAEAESNEARIIQTNALAGLVRMRAAEARLAIREFALSKEANFRMQTLKLLGGFGDPAMIPLLEEAAKKYGADGTANAARDAIVAIESRAESVNGGRK